MALLAFNLDKYFNVQGASSSPIMSQCVPSWDLEDAPAAARHLRRSSAAPDHVPMLDYDEVAELTWENGQLAMHGLGPPRSNVKLLVSTSGTLESIVNQATSTSTSLPGGRKPSLFPWFEMDAMVPCSKASEGEVGRGKRGAGTSKQGRVGMAVAPEWSGSATLGRESQRVRVDRYEATSLASGGNTRTTTGDDQDDSVCHRRGNKKQEACDDEEVEVEVEKSRSRSRSRSRETCGKFSINSTKRSRAAAIHNQSERKRRDKINQRMKTLQKLVPNSSKTDKASMLDEVIEYLKQLQAQVQMMSRFMINVPHMMALSQAQHQLHMPMMTPMGMGMGMAAMGMSLGLGMGVLDIVARPTPLLPNSFIPITASSSSWDATQPDRLHPADPLSTFLACHPHPHHPITMDAYTRLQAAMYHHQLQQNPPPPSSSKNS